LYASSPWRCAGVTHPGSVLEALMPTSASMMGLFSVVARAISAPSLEAPLAPERPTAPE
jgi:hypothetical protein